jgi:hypothetical protein
MKNFSIFHRSTFFNPPVPSVFLFIQSDKGKHATALGAVQHAPSDHCYPHHLAVGWWNCDMVVVTVVQDVLRGVSGNSFISS